MTNDTMERVRPSTDMSGEELATWRTQQAGDYAYARNHTRPCWNPRRASHWYVLS